MIHLFPKMPQTINHSVLGPHENVTWSAAIGATLTIVPSDPPQPPEGALADAQAMLLQGDLQDYRHNYPANSPSISGGRSKT